MRLAAQLRIFTGVTAVIGSGGKTMLRGRWERSWRPLAGCCCAPLPKYFHSPACPAPGQRQNWTNSGGATALCAPEAL